MISDREDMLYLQGAKINIEKHFSQLHLIEREVLEIITTLTVQMVRRIRNDFAKELSDENCRA